MTLDSIDIYIPKFDVNLDPVMVQSASDYIVLTHLLRRLVQVDEGLKINADLAKRWTVEDDFTLFNFVIEDNQYFSDGTAITPNHIKLSIERQIKFNKAIHFDFSLIESVSVDNNNLIIRLKRSSPNFIYQLSHPEFGVLTSEQSSADLRQIDFSVSSGFYFLKKKSVDSLQLSSNELLSNRVPRDLIFLFKDFNWDVEGKNVFWLSTKISDKEVKRVKSSNSLVLTKPHIGFTYWLSLNPSSQVFKERQDRLAFSEKFKISKEEISNTGVNWSKAEQLYLPGGSGRNTADEIAQIWNLSSSSSTVDFSKSEVSVYLQKEFPTNQLIIDRLNEIFHDVKVSFYSSISEFGENYLDYDLFLINNDFSSLSVLENIKVTLSSSRPLIFGLDSKILNLLKEADSTSKIEVQLDALKNIEAEILKQRLIIPIAFYQLYFVSTKKLKLDKWSKVTPEVSFWKVYN